MANVMVSLNDRQGLPAPWQADVTASPRLGADHDVMPYTAVFQVITPVIPQMSLLESELAFSQPGLFPSLLHLPCSCLRRPTHDAQAAWHSLGALPL